MNSFKKLALALVATMTLGTLTAIPANASSGTATLKVGNATQNGGVGLTASNPSLLPVPADNSVDSGDALQISITGLLNNTTATANVVNGRVVAALATVANPVTASSGSTSLALNTGTGTTLDFYVFTTLATDGSVSISVAGNTTTYYFKASAGALNSISLTAPATAAAGTTEKVTVSGFDVFGNPKGGAVINLQVITTTSTTTALTTDTATTLTTVIGTKTSDVLIPASGAVTLVATASVASSYPGLAVPVGLVIKTVTVRDLLAELNAVKAELAAEKAARAADKVSADKALADAKAIAAAELATAKADAATAKLNADNALLLANKAAEEAKIASDKVIADLKAQVAALNKALASLKKRYNSMAKKFKFTPLP